MYMYMYVRVRSRVVEPYSSGFYQYLTPRVCQYAAFETVFPSYAVEVSPLNSQCCKALVPGAGAVLHHCRP